MHTGVPPAASPFAVRGLSNGEPYRLELSASVQLRAGKVRERTISYQDQHMLS